MLNQLTTITGASGKLTKGKDGKSTVDLVLTTENGSLAMPLTQFDAIYRGMVKCWPVISPLKLQLVEAQRTEVAAERDAKKEQAKAEKEKAKADAKARREATIADAKAKKAEKAAGAGLKELARLLKAAKVVDVAEASKALAGDVSLLKPQAVKKLKAAVAYSAKLDKQAPPAGSK